MNDAWDDRRRVLEDEYIERQNQAALEKLAHAGEGTQPKSPITGKAMVREDVLGITIDRCPDSGGVWLDKGELGQLLNRARQQESGGPLSSWLHELWSTVTGK